MVPLLFRFQKWAILAANTLAFVSFLLTLIWMGVVLTSYSSTKRGVETVITPQDKAGFSWADGNGKVFNWHPPLMVMGMLLCNTMAVTSFRGLSSLDHGLKKKIHLFFHTLAILVFTIGLRAVFKFHNEHNITNLYSLHSWIGLFTVILFYLQWCIGFYNFFFPRTAELTRVALVPVHAVAGMFIYCLATAASALGILQKLSFNNSCNITGLLDGQRVEGYMASDCVMGNTIGLLLVFTLAMTIVALASPKSVQDHNGKPSDTQGLSAGVTDEHPSFYGKSSFGAGEGYEPPGLSARR